MPALDLKCALENAGLMSTIGMLAFQDIVLQLFESLLYTTQRDESCETPHKSGSGKL